MFSILIALAILLAAVAAIYLILRNMGQDGVEIAAPGSCKRGRCGVQSRTPAEMADAGEAPLPASENTTQDNNRA